MVFAQLQEGINYLIEHDYVGETWPDAIRWVGATASTVATNAGPYSLLEFYYAMFAFAKSTALDESISPGHRLQYLLLCGTRHAEGQLNKTNPPDAHAMRSIIDDLVTAVLALRPHVTLREQHAADANLEYARASSYLASLQFDKALPHLRVCHRHARMAKATLNAKAYLFQTWSAASFCFKLLRRSDLASYAAKQAGRALPQTEFCGAFARNIQFLFLQRDPAVAAAFHRHMLKMAVGGPLVQAQLRLLTGCAFYTSASQAADLNCAPISRTFTTANLCHPLPIALEVAVHVAIENAAVDALVKVRYHSYAVRRLQQTAGSGGNRAPSSRMLAVILASHTTACGGRV